MKITDIARKNAMQSKSVILMIALSTMLICAVVNLGTSVQKSFYNNFIEQAGDMHVSYINITSEQADLLSMQHEVELADLVLTLNGQCNPPDNEKQELAMIYSSALGQTAGFKLTAGHTPQAETDVVIPPHVAELLGIDPKAGEEFDIIYHSSHNSVQTLHFTVSGILQEQPLYAAANMNFVFVSQAIAEQYEYECSLSLRFNKKYAPRDTAYKLAEIAGVLDKDIFINEQYLITDQQDISVIMLTGVILLILCASGALVIYNAYNLSVVKKINQYGLLTVIGASKRQLRFCVYLEALYCSAVGLPFGLLTGTLVGYGSIGILDRLTDASIYYTASPAAYLLAAVITLIMVFIGVMRPSRRAAQISPVEAVRFTDTVEKTYSRTTFQDVTLNTLVKINLIRAKSQTTSTIISLTLSGVLFLGFSIPAFSMLNGVDDLNNNMAGDIQITVGKNGMTSKSNPLTHEIVNTIRNIDGVYKAFTFMAQDICDIGISNTSESYLGSQSFVIGAEPVIMQGIIDRIYSDEYISLADFDDPHNVIAVIPSPKWKRNSDLDQSILAPYFVGSKLDFALTGQTGQISNETVTLNIIGLVYDDNIPNYVNERSQQPMLYTLQDSFSALGWNEAYERAILFIDGKEYDGIYSAIESLCMDDNDLNIESIVLFRMELTKQITGVIVVVMLMLAVVALTGIMNLVGTTFIGFEQRKKELGVLLALGLSRKGIGKMLKKEGYWVTVRCTSLSTIFGLTLGYGLYLLLNNIGWDFMRFVFPIWPLVSLCTIYGFVPYIITSFMVRRLRKLTITDLMGRQA